MLSFPGSLWRGHIHGLVALLSPGHSARWSFFWGGGAARRGRDWCSRSRSSLLSPHTQECYKAKKLTNFVKLLLKKEAENCKRNQSFILVPSPTYSTKWQFLMRACFEKDGMLVLSTGKAHCWDQRHLPGQGDQFAPQFAYRLRYTHAQRETSKGEMHLLTYPAHWMHYKNIKVQVNVQFLNVGIVQEVFSPKGVLHIFDSFSAHFWCVLEPSSPPNKTRPILAHFWRILDAFLTHFLFLPTPFPRTPFLEAQ